MIFKNIILGLLCIANLLFGPTKDIDVNNILKESINTFTYKIELEAREDALEKYRAELEKLRKSRVRIFAAGDFMTHGPQLKGAKYNDGYKFDEYFKYLPFFKEADLAMINYETTVSYNGQYTGYPTFSSPESSVEAIKNSGFDVLATANNHAFDKGFKGIDKTIDTIKSYGMDNVGTYKDANNMPLIKEVNGIKFGISAYTYSINGFDSRVKGTDKAYAVNFIDMDKIKKDVEYMDANDVDVKLVYMHWGVEYQLKPNKAQENTAKKLNELGVDIILGSHPHVIQKCDVIESGGKKTYVCYSMGNFVSNQRREFMPNRYSENELMMEVILQKTPNGVVVEKFEAHPLWVDKYRTNGRDHYNVIPVREALDGSVKVERINQIKNKLLQSLEDFNSIYK